MLKSAGIARRAKRSGALPSACKLVGTCSMDTHPIVGWGIHLTFNQIQSRFT